MSGNALRDMEGVLMKYGGGTLLWDNFDGTFWWTILVEYVVETCGRNLFIEQFSGTFFDGACGWDSRGGQNVMFLKF